MKNQGEEEERERWVGENSRSLGRGKVSRDVCVWMDAWQRRED